MSKQDKPKEVISELTRERAANALGVELDQLPTGAKHIIDNLNRAIRQNKHKQRVRKPSPKGRAARVAKQKKSRPGPNQTDNKGE